MARPRRSHHPGVYHLTAHGSDTRYLFLTDEDREDFLGRLAFNVERFELALLSWVLLGNHYHALLRIEDARLSLALQRLHTEYSRHHNRRHGRGAHLFEAHPYTGEIASEKQLVAAARYLARNPVKAGLVADPLDWPWSSARSHAGLEPPRIPLHEADLQVAFGGTERWRDAYREEAQRPGPAELPKERKREARSRGTRKNGVRHPPVSSEHRAGSVQLRPPCGGTEHVGV
jgi:putative transposase